MSPEFIECKLGTCSSGMRTEANYFRKTALKIYVRKTAVSRVNEINRNRQEHRQARPRSPTAGIENDPPLLNTEWPSFSVKQIEK